MALGMSSVAFAASYTYDVSLDYETVGAFYKNDDDRIDGTVNFGSDITPGKTLYFPISVQKLDANNNVVDSDVDKASEVNALSFGLTVD